MAPAFSLKLTMENSDDDSNYVARREYNAKYCTYKKEKHVVCGFYEKKN